MDDYLKIFIDSEAFKNSNPQGLGSDRELKNLVELIEMESACSKIAIGADENLEYSVVEGIYAWMRQSVFEKLRTKLESAYGPLKTNVVAVYFEIQTPDYHLTRELAEKLREKSILVKGYWELDFSKGRCDICSSYLNRIFHDISELKKEKQQVWDLSCEAAKSSDLEELFGIRITPVKTGNVNDPIVGWGITKGPKIPKEFQKYVAEIHVRSLYRGISI